MNLKKKNYIFNLKFISNKFFLFLNFKIFRTLLKILPLVSLKIKGFYVIIKMKKKFLLLYLNILKKNSSFLFNYLIDVVIVDYPWKKNRFFINYIIRSIFYSKLIIVFVKTSLYNNVYSISNIFNSASWIERECWDLFGVFFFLHKNLKRILTDYGFKGHPLKKDFPLVGFDELYYNILGRVLEYKKIIN